jgi:N-acetylmuramoyl-L-alanine amidase
MGVLPLTPEDAAAILGSFGTETGGFTLREESNGKGYGWAQWTGERRTDFENWCRSNGHDPYGTDDEYDAACFAFFVHEVTQTWEKRVLIDGGTISGVFYPPLCNCGTLDAKTESFWRLYERPGTPHADWRQEMAQEALRIYQGGKPGGKPMPYKSIVLSSGHGKYVRGASGIIDEVDEARKVVDALAQALADRGVDVVTFHDDTSKDQSTNLETIVDAHNDEERDLDISVHFNAFEQREQPVGTEVLYYSQAELAGKVSAAIASCGFINRGAKKNTGLYFLNNTEKPSILIEVCFVDSEGDCEVYAETFDDIITAIADVIGGKLVDETEPPVEPGEEVPPPDQPVARIDIEVSGEVVIFINGEQVGTKG